MVTYRSRRCRCMPTLVLVIRIYIDGGKIFSGCFLHLFFKIMMFRELRVGTNITGPGEAVFAIRFAGKPQFLLKIKNFRTREKFEKSL